MLHKFLRYLTCTSLLLSLTAVSLSAQPCADTQPAIAGAQIVSNNQLGVIYSTPNIPGHTYSWSITGGVIVSGGNTNQVNVNWGPVGNGSLTLTETNPSIPCSTQITKAIKIQPLLISYFYYTNTSCYGDMLSFWDASVNDVAKPIVNYYIDFGDATPVYSSPVKPFPVTHTYAAPYNVTYTITYIVTNNEGTNDTIYDAVYVNPNQFIPTAAFTFVVPNCSYQAVTFDASSSTTPPLTTPFERYSWDFGDPASGSANYDSCKTCVTTSHLFSGPGTYNVTLTVLNHTSCTNSITQQVVINQSVPTAAYTFSSPTCENNAVFFTDQSTFPLGRNIVTWQWYFGDGTPPVIINAPASPNVSHIFPALGPYNVELRVINNLGCVDSAYHSVGLTPSPVADFVYGIPCAGDTLHFQNHSLPNNGPAIVSYYWNYGDPASGNNTSNGVDGAHVYINPGVYTTTLAVANTTGCSDTIRKTFTINPKPPVEFTWNVGSINNQIQFHIDSTITPLGMIGNMCQWNFGDGQYGTGHNPVHTYLGSNNWIVTLTVTDTLGCSASISHVVYVPEIPMAFYSSNAPVCLGNPMCFTDLSSVPSPPFGYITRWVWDYNDGSPNDTIYFPNNPNTCHVYANPGVYMVTLSVTDNSGFTDSYSHDQTVLPLPIANFLFTTGCAGKLVQFTDASFPNGGGNVISWDWDFGDPLSGGSNTSNLQNPSHIFNTGGVTYNVRLIIRNFDDCRDTIIKPVYIFPSPPVDFTRDTACVNELVHFFTDTVITHPDSIVTWLWAFGDGTTGTDPINTSHLYPAPGTYVASLTVTDHHGCENTVSHQVKVNPLPIPEFSWSTPACTDNPVTYTDMSTVPAGYTGYVAKWMWDFNDGSTQTIVIPGNPNVSHTFLTPTLTHLVRLTVWTSDSCTFYVEHTVTSVPSPTANFSYSTVTCAGQTVQFTDLSQTNGGGIITQWHWDFGDPGSGLNNTSTIPSPPHTYDVAGNYTVTLIIQNATGCPDTIVKTVTVNQLPLANFTADTACLGSITTFTDSSLPNALSILTYAWEFGDGGLSSMKDPTHTYLTAGFFNVKLTIVNSNGCTKDTTKQILVNPLPISEFSFTSPNCFGAQVCYTDLSHTVPGYLGSIVKWVWDFNDGTFQTITFPGNPNVCHTFVGNALSHLVKLTVTTTDSCTAFITHQVNSIPAPIANFSFPGITCANQSVQFSDLSQNNGGGSIISWNWNFGDPLSGTQNTSTSKNPIHFFSSFGTFNVTLIVQNTDGCQDTIIKPVTVSQLPVANFAADTACLGSITTFTDSSLPNGLSIITYSWDFGDGSPGSTLQNPTHIYSNYGLFNVTLTVTNNNGCVKDTTKQILVNPLPIPAFTYTTPNCLGAVVQYTNQSTTVPGYLGSIVTWVWDFDDGTPPVTINFPGNPSISHTFAGAALIHNVKLTVTTSDGCTAFIVHQVNSIPSPVADFSFPTSDCAHQSVQFTDLSQANGGGNIIQWHWDFGDPGSGGSNNSTSQNPTHIFSGSGVFTVTLIVYNASNCTDTMMQDVTVIPLPVAKFTSDTACLGSLTCFTDQSTATGTIVQRFWEFGDGGTSNQTNPCHLYLSAGTFNVKLTVTTNEGCIKDTTEPVLVIPKPVASFIATAPTCSGDSVCFTDLSTTPHGTIVTWLWNFGDGNTTTVNFPGNPNVCHLYAAGGTYSVSLTITTSDNCTDVKTTPVIIQPAPVANYTYATTRCANEPVQFTDLSQSGGGSAITQWLWNFGDPGSGSANTSTVKDPTHNFTHSGTFQVNLMVTSAAGCFDSITKPVTINAAPVAQFSADTACTGSVTQFTDESVPNATSISAWNWNFGDPSSGTNNTSTLQNPTHTYNSSGLYSVTLSVTNSNSCTHDTIIQVSVNPKPTAMFSASVSCVGDSTAFTDLSIAPGSGLSAWYWDFGDGGSSTLQNPKHVYATANTFSVMLRVTNLSNCQDSIVIPVTTRPKPVAAFTYTSFFCPAGQVAFQDQSTGTGAAIVEREWIFMPGSTSSLINPTFIFPVTDTTYLVTLIVTDSYGCMDTVSDSVYVKPGFAFTFQNDTVCFKNPTHFTAVDLAQGDSLYNPKWEFGDPNSGPNNISYQFAPTHTFTQPGIFIVKLRVTDSDNCTDSLYKEVTVHALPAPAFSIQSLPCDSVIHFRDSTSPGSGGIASWEWTFGDGTPPVIIPGSTGSGDTSHIYLAEAVYPVLLRVTNTYGCVDTITKMAELYPCIVAGFTHADTLLCSRYDIAFSDTSLPVNIINQWHWIFGDGTDTIYTTHTGVVHHTYTSPGSYFISLIIHAQTGSGRTFSDTITQPIVIHPTPLPLFSNESVCKLQTTQFRDTSNTYGTPISSWKWNFGDPYSIGDTSHQKNPTYKYDSARIYDVNMVVMNSFGCKDSIMKPTRIYEIPTAVFNHSIACSGNPTYFTDKSLIADTANIINWFWNFGEAGSNHDTSELQNPSHQYKNEGDYVVHLIVKDQHGCYDTVDSTVTVNITPMSSFTFTENINHMTGKLQFKNKSSGADTYFWDFGNGQTSTDENPVVTYANDGSFLIMLVSNNQYNCTDTTYYKYEFIFKGLYIPNAFAPTSLSPGASTFTPIGVNLKQFKIEVFDSWGHLVWTSTALDALGRPSESWIGKDADGVALPSGTYMWKAKATFIDNTIWEGSDIGKGSYRTFGTVTLIR